MVALVMLVVASVAGFFVFRRVVNSALHAPGATGVPASPGLSLSPGGGVPGQAPPQPSGKPGTAGRQEPILRLRDLVAGTVAVSTTQASLALDSEQKEKLGKLLPRVRANMEGNAAQVDSDLEKLVKEVLKAPQWKAIIEWRGQQKVEPDYVQELKKLEQMCGSGS